MSVFHSATTYVVLVDKRDRHWIEKTTVGNALRLIADSNGVAHFLDASEAGRYADQCNRREEKE